MEPDSNYRICTRCIMDTSAPGIVFDENGACSFCRDFDVILEKRQRRVAASEELLPRIIEPIKAEGEGKPYDCVIGVSGGIDSSYALYRSVQLGLRPLAVHLDNGWNTTLSEENIQCVVKGLGVDLRTYSVDPEEFTDLQRAFFKAGVIDIEILSDHAIVAQLYRTAAEEGVRFILGGTNTASEGLKIPKGWNHFKMDLLNIRSVYRRHGEGLPLKSIPTMGVMRYLMYRFVRRMRWIDFLDYMRYKKKEAVDTLQREFGWQPYEKKHYESVFTRFYQAHILPRKFGVDKRRVHYSNMICTGEMSRRDALSAVERATYEDQSVLENDRRMVLERLRFSEEEFEDYLNAPAVSHYEYASGEWVYDTLLALHKRLRSGESIDQSLFSS